MMSQMCINTTARTLKLLSKLQHFGNRRETLYNTVQMAWNGTGVCTRTGLRSAELEAVASRRTGEPREQQAAWRGPARGGSRRQSVLHGADGGVPGVQERPDRGRAVRAVPWSCGDPCYARAAIATN